MSLLVKTKRQANFNDFKRFGTFKGFVEQKNVVFSSFMCQLGFFGTPGPLKRSFHSRFKLAHSCHKTPIYTRTRQINYYYIISGIKAILQDSSVKIADDEGVSRTSSVITRVSCNML
jgi:hypothetical protein